MASVPPSGLSKGAAEWLANHATRYHQRWGVIGVGIDTLSLDVGQSVRYPAHVALFANNIYGIENLANLDRVMKQALCLALV